MEKLEKERLARRAAASPHSMPMPPRAAGLPPSTRSDNRGHEYTGVGSEEQANEDFDQFAANMGRLKGFKPKKTFQQRFGVHPLAIVIPLLLTLIMVVLKAGQSASNASAAAEADAKEASQSPAGAAGKGKAEKNKTEGGSSKKGGSKKGGDSAAAAEKETDVAVDDSKKKKSGSKTKKKKKNAKAD